MIKEGISIIIPVYNEEDGLKVVLKELKESVTEFKFPTEIIVIDDGSVDNSSQIAKKENVKVIAHPRNFGYGAAIKTGIRESQYNNLLTVDGDASYSLNNLIQLIKELDKYHLVLGVRRGKIYKGRPLKRLLRFLYRVLVKYVTGDKIPDANTGLRAFKKEIILPYMDYFCNGFSFSTTLTMICVLNGFFVGFVPVQFHNRLGKSKIKWARDILRMGQILISAITLYNPIKIFLPLSILCLLLGILSSWAYAVTSKSMYILASALFIGESILIFGLGLIADLMSNLRKK